MSVEFKDNQTASSNSFAGRWGLTSCKFTSGGCCFTLDCFPQGSSLGQLLQSCSPLLASHFSCFQLTCPPPLDSSFILSSTLHPTVTSSTFPNPSLFSFYFYFSLLGFSSSTRRGFNPPDGNVRSERNGFITRNNLCSRHSSVSWSVTGVKHL